MNSPVQTVSREMKDSGVEWIGEIPKEWGVCPLLAFANERKNKNSSLEVDNLLSLSYGKIIKKDINSTEGLLPESYSGYNIVEQGDIVIRPTDLQNDKRSLRSAIVEERGIITSAYIALQPSKKVLPRYCHYLLRAYDTCKVFYNLGSGVRQSLNYKEFSKLPVLEVSIAEQQRIANYLDRKCGQIDAIIEKQKLVIEKLKAYKLSVITEAVTKGLDLNIEMKDSGVEWIGEIPISYDVVPIVKQLRSIVDYRGKTPEKVSEGVFLVTAKNIKDGKIDYNISQEFVRSEDFEEVMRRGKADIGDVLFTTEAPLGQVANVDKEDIALAQRIIKFKPSKKLSPYYLCYWIRSAGFQDFLKSLATGSTALGLKASKLFMLKMVLPPPPEQNDIVNYLNVKSAAIDSAIAKKENLITKLTAYKKSLIYELVTGKRAV